jgi:small subunit ribosomal protein S20
LHETGKFIPKPFLQSASQHARICFVVFARTDVFFRLKEVTHMPNIKSAIKRTKQIEKRRAQRASQKSDLRSAMKNFEKAVAANDVELAKSTLLVAVKKLDKAATKGLIHKNAANRQKSRLMKKLNALVASVA